MALQSAWPCSSSSTGEPGRRKSPHEGGRSRRGNEADFGAEVGSASLPRRLLNDRHSSARFDTLHRDPYKLLCCEQRSVPFRAVDRLLPRMKYRWTLIPAQASLAKSLAEEL